MKQDEIKCPKCHAIFTKYAFYCPNCGAKLADALAVNEEKLTEENMVKEVEEKATEILPSQFPQSPFGHQAGETTVLAQEPVIRTDPYQGKAYIEYYGERKVINQQIFVIGALNENVDFFIDNDYISSKHAEIISHENRWYVKDLNTTNKTYLNGVMLPTDREVEIRDNDTLRLANVDVTFHIG